MAKLAQEEALMVRALVRGAESIGEWISPALQALVTEPEGEVTTA